MKKRLFTLLLVLSLALPLFALADGAAPDITADCRIQMPNSSGLIRDLRDRNGMTAISAEAYRNPYIVITPPEGQTVAAVYVEFGRKPMQFTVQKQVGKEWVAIGASNEGYQQLYAEFEPTAGPLRVQFNSGGVARTLCIRELYVYGEGARDESVAHIWQPTVEKADILFITTHPDDEILWFGGAIPTYAGAKGAATAVLYATCRYEYRLLELLNGLWHCGVRTYPIVGDFQDFSTPRWEDVLTNWGRKAFTDFLVTNIRRLRPEVIVTQDLQGEYGHSNHIAVTTTVTQALALAADESYDGAGSLAAYGAWQVKKLYVHLGEDPTTVMDWHQPLEFFDGKDAYQVACEAFTYHRSQQTGKYAVADVGDPYDSSKWTLYFSTVGEDTVGGDFFENIPEDCLQ